MIIATIREIAGVERLSIITEITISKGSEKST
jgi:hypothetical protein